MFLELNVIWAAFLMQAAWRCCNGIMCSLYNCLKVFSVVVLFDLMNHICVWWFLDCRFYMDQSELTFVAFSWMSTLLAKLTTSAKDSHCNSSSSDNGGDGNDDGNWCNIFLDEFDCLRMAKCLADVDVSVCVCVMILGCSGWCIAMKWNDDQCL